VSARESDRSDRLVAVPLAVWALHVALGYAVAGLNCHRHYFDASLAGVEIVRVVFVATTLAFAAIVALVGTRSALAWRALRGDGADDPLGRQAFLRALTALVSALALVYLLWASVFPFLSDTCG
jgi:hypothetical protein